jgi:hypothetical protein
MSSVENLKIGNVKKGFPLHGVSYFLSVEGL